MLVLGWIPDIVSFTMCAGHFNVPINILELCSRMQLTYLKKRVIRLRVAFQRFKAGPSPFFFFPLLKQQPSKESISCPMTYEVLHSDWQGYKPSGLVCALQIVSSAPLGCSFLKCL